VSASATLAYNLAMLKQIATSVVTVGVAVSAVGAQQPAAPARDTLPNEPRIFDSSTRGPSGSPIAGPRFRVVPTKGLSRPYALAFLPDGSMLITERAGRLRIVKDGVLDPQPIAGMPAVLDRNLKGLNDIALHPDFAQNRTLYFTYYKPSPDAPDAAFAVLARARYTGGHALSDVTDIFTTSQVINQPSASRLVFGRDGKIYLGIGVPIPARTTAGNVTTTTDAQSPGSHFGKVLRLNDDGTAAADNPFVGRAGYKPEIFAFGIRNAMGLAVHPETGEIWETENGPQGGDELNIIRAGKNYGWPTISYGRSYTGDVTGATGPSQDPPVSAGLEQPMLFWAPSIALSGLAFYTGDRFPEWKGSIFVGALVGTQLQRVVMNTRGLPIRRDMLLWELRQRIREVRQGPDGLLYLLTDEEAGALLRLEPVAAGSD
jgi:glucose/arabinose dehydrogenase